MLKHTLTLYIMGYTPIAKLAIKNLNFLRQKSEIQEFYEIDIINLLKHPELIKQHKILATPVLLIGSSSTPRKIVGDLSNHEKVLFSLGIGGLNE